MACTIITAFRRIHCAVFHVRRAERFSMAQEPLMARTVSLPRLHDHTQTHRTRLDMRSVRRREDIRAVGGNQTHNPSQQGKRPQTHALGRTLKNSKTSSLKTATLGKCVRNCTSQMCDRHVAFLATYICSHTSMRYIL
jgi:hypothetical protein